MSISTVLVVDDEVDIRRIVEISLGRMGKWRVHAIASGAKAVEAAVEHKPDVILLDLMMPGFDGPMTLRALKLDPRTAAIPIIFFSAMTRPEERAPYLAIGAIGMVEKPFDPVLLPGQVTRIFEAR